MNNFPTPNKLHEAELGFDDRCFQPIVLNYSTSLLPFLTLMGLIETRKTPFQVGGIFFLTQKS